ncbi:NAD(P)-dependent glycerol-3-phosphate dehydrogenase [Rhodobacteraceae bacterium KMM 6894]|nr:NAD(P)-dependent glycerol-3-phosphate dehydrogenase [Rhodobacteraceae bacterium KMM 6894]
MSRVVVIGGGAWGTALACVAARAGRDTVLLCRDATMAAALSAGQGNPRYLPGVTLSERFKATTDPAILRGAGTVILAIPAQSLRSALPAFDGVIGADAVLINTAKGIERASGLTLSHAIADTLPGRAQAILSGPSFAVDVAAGKPTAVTLAAATRAQALTLCEAISSDTFRAYASDDITGVETGGALKNVYAIAAGVVIGMGFGESAKAALITRAFVELRALGCALGGQGQTFMGLSGFGDLMLSCASAMSRNFSYGMALGQGEDLTGRPLAEGVATTGIAAKVADAHGVDAPILQATHAILTGDLTPQHAMQNLLSRPIKEEF